MMSVLLGVLDAEISSQSVQNPEGLNKVGGLQELSGKVNLQSCQCPNCSTEGVLVCQLYAPLDESPNHRILLVLFCNTCPKESSFFCWRVEYPDTTQPSGPKTPDISPSSDWDAGADDWGESVDDWGRPAPSTSDVSLQLKSLQLTPSSEPVSHHSRLHRTSLNASSSEKGLEELPLEIATAEVEKDAESDMVISDVPEDLLQLANASVIPQVLTECIKTNRRNVPLNMFKPYYISVIEDFDSRDMELKKYDAIRREYEEKEGKTPEELGSKKSGKKGEASEGYEKVGPAHGDKLAHKFLEVVRRCPYQILRYSQTRGVGAVSLLDLRSQKLTCRHCGGSSLFELQVMPYLSDCLKPIDPSTQSAIDGVRVEFGTVIIFTCKASCWSASDPIRSEIVVYQDQPL